MLKYIFRFGLNFSRAKTTQCTHCTDEVIDFRCFTYNLDLQKNFDNFRAKTIWCSGMPEAHAPGKNWMARTHWVSIYIYTYALRSFP
jgi:hypothetical protein